MATSPRRTIVYDAAALHAPDARTVDALARLKLDLGRRGFELRLVHVPDALRELLAFVGLAEVLRVEPRRQPEEREQRLGIEEERELDDPSL
jgi:anti-anti-sigma regulatory factor